ncbi:MAG: acetyl-CoA carboxylase biotin carboxylase subunit [Candidatus Hydrothermae bacterium]|nr:acetyl-CoA carboxylase biotin carboxylase subunit [Candidatus Hydrothermae bacterium]
MTDAKVRDVRRVLVANRGEIALRVIRALKELGLESVAVYSETDRDSLHVQLADYAICIGPPSPQKSYLNIPQLISAALVTGSQAIHPGYGFLAENADFARIARQHKLVFLGPSPESIELMGDKIRAKQVMQEAGVPVVPGSDGPVDSLGEVRVVAREIGYPLLLKAVAGGGGRGMRVVEAPEDLQRAYDMARSEAQAAFSDSRLYVERYIARPRHIEVQVMGDRHGHAVHFFERECSIQRRHQKLIEEAPSPVLTPEERAQLGEIALKAVHAIRYETAGTLEFLFDERRREFYFIEMNTRIQVEHPVTEMVTGVDLVKLQILTALGHPLPLKQKEISLSGHAIELRINAEDPTRDFQPRPGRIEALHLPGGPGIRVDTHIFAGYTVPPYYDSLIAKLIAWGNTREETLRRLQRALDEWYLEGFPTTVPLHRKVLEHPDFRAGRMHTHFLEQSGVLHALLD